MTCDHQNSENPNNYHSTIEKGRVCCHCYEEYVRTHFQMSEVLLGSIKRWVEGGVMPGGFLMSVLRNAPVSLVCGLADTKNALVLPKIVHYLLNHCPHQCWGSAEKVSDWASHGGEKGLV